MEAPTQSIRLNRYLAQCGLGARRKVETYVLNGEIQINNRVVQDLSTQVHPKDCVTHLGRLLLRQSLAYIVLNKPKDHLCTRQGQKTIYELLGAENQHLNYVGRLDRNTTGVLLLSNDGALAQRLTHPSRGVPKTYCVRIDPLIRLKDLARLRQGVWLDDGWMRPDQVDLRGSDVHIILHSGKNRVIRRTFETLGYRVVALDRVAFGCVRKGHLQRGQWRMLSTHEIEGLRKY